MGISTDPLTALSSVAKNSNSSSLLLLSVRNLLHFLPWETGIFDAHYFAFCGPAFLVGFGFNASHLFVAFPYTNQPCYFVCYVGFEKLYKMERCKLPKCLAVLGFSICITGAMSNTTAVADFFEDLNQSLACLVEGILGQISINCIVCPC